MEGIRSEGFVEVGVVEYPGGDPSAASVLAEMAHVANRVAQQQRRPFKRVLVTRWIVPASRSGVHRIAGADMLDAAIPAVIAVPGQVSSTASLRTDEILLDWLRAHYDGGSLLAAAADGVSVLARAGLLAGRTVSGPDLSRHPGLVAQAVSWVPSERALVDDGDLLTVAGVQAWRFLGLRLLHRLFGQGVASAVATQLAITVPEPIQQDLERFSANFAHGDRDVLKAQRWLHTTAARGATLASICEVAGLEPRTCSAASSERPGCVRSNTASDCGWPRRRHCCSRGRVSMRWPGGRLCRSECVPASVPAHRRHDAGELSTSRQQQAPRTPAAALRGREPARIGAGADAGHSDGAQRGLTIDGRSSRLHRRRDASTMRSVDR